MIHSWPADTKAFYMKRDEINNNLALGVDMIAPEGYGEIVGGGQREDNIDILIETIRHHDLPLKPFEWYLDLRKYGSFHTRFWTRFREICSMGMWYKTYKRDHSFSKDYGKIRAIVQFSYKCFNKYYMYLNFLVKIMKVALCQINPTVGALSDNVRKIIDVYNDALNSNCDIIVFPELAITGYPPQDLLLNDKFIEANSLALNKIVKQVTAPAIIGYVRERKVTYITRQL